MNVSGSSNGWFNYLIASDDLGKNWKILPGKSMYGTNESQIIQLSDSSFLINARSHRYDKNDKTTPTEWNPWNFDKLPHYRASIIVSINKDQTKWFPTKICTNLPDPHCQGAIYRYSGLKMEKFLEFCLLIQHLRYHIHLIHSKGLPPQPVLMELFV